MRLIGQEIRRFHGRVTRALREIAAEALFPHWGETLWSVVESYAETDQITDSPPRCASCGAADFSPISIEHMIDCPWIDAQQLTGRSPE